MWTRKQLKNGAKATLDTCFGKSILVCLILSIIQIISTLFFAQFLTFQIYTLDNRLWYSFYYFIPISKLPLVFIFLLICIFLLNPLYIGQVHFFLSSRVKDSGISTYKFAFQKSHYGNICKVMFLTRLTISLFSVLFVIPGMYKAYQYRMVPYLLAENPKMDYHRAVYLSTSMMKGEKWKAFVLDLSFIGWYIPCVLTCTILSFVYVNPYYNHTTAGLYIMLREKIMDLKLVDSSELYAVFYNPQTEQPASK